MCVQRCCGRKWIAFSEGVNRMVCGIIYDFYY